MPVMPGTDFRPNTSSSTALMKRYDILCFHTLVGYVENGGAAHWSTRYDGYIYQWKDTKYQSEANYNGNYRVLAVEDEDHGPAYGVWNTSDGHAVPAFTALQCEAAARIAVWSNKTHAIPLKMAPDSKTTSRGIAYHRMGIPGNFADYAYPGVVTGGEIWTKYYGKVCPGDRRINQVINIVVPRANAILNPPVPQPVPPPEDDMFTDADRDTLYAMAYRLNAIEDWKHQVASTALPTSIRNEPVRLIDNLQEIMDVQKSGLTEAEYSNSFILRKLDDLMATILAATGQPEWADTDAQTWDELHAMRWAHVEVA